MNRQQIIGILRRVYGALLGVIGLNHVGHFVTTPAYSGKAGAVYEALQQAGYVLPAVGLVMLLTATTLLFNRYVTPGLLMLTPVLVNMLLFHLFLAPAGIVPALTLSSITLYLLTTQPLAWKLVTQPA